MHQNPTDVLPVSSPAVSEDIKPQTGLPVEPVVTTDKPTPGDKTPEANLLAALKEERAKRKELEDKITNLTTAPTDEEIISEEGRVLHAQIQSLQDRIERKDLEDKFPALKEFADEFNQFKAEYPRNKMENVAKLFLQEKGLLEVPRKGLEKTTGGQRNPISAEMTADDVKNLRENNFKKYKDMLQKGLIKI